MPGSPARACPDRTRNSPIRNETCNYPVITISLRSASLIGHTPIKTRCLQRRISRQRPGCRMPSGAGDLVVRPTANARMAGVERIVESCNYVSRARNGPASGPRQAGATQTRVVKGRPRRPLPAGGVQARTMGRRSHCSRSAAAAEDFRQNADIQMCNRIGFHPGGTGDRGAGVCRSATVCGGKQCRM